MNTKLCFVLLLATGLALKTEFQIDFTNLVNTVPVDGRTYLDCSDDCSEVEATGCGCVEFEYCKIGLSTYKCIENGLRKLRFTPSKLFLMRLKIKLNNSPLERVQWSTRVSPKTFLTFIQEIEQKSNAQSIY